MSRLSRWMLCLSALFLAPSCESPEKHALRELSRAGIQPSGRALVQAVTLDETQHVRWLLDVRVHSEQRDAHGHTPLRIAIGKGSSETALTLLEAKADPHLTDRHHKSTIYHSSMPYFQRLSCSDFGFHFGHVSNRPASHGCIRIPMDAAKQLFAMTGIGDTVTIKP